MSAETRIEREHPYTASWNVKPGKVWVQWPELDFPLPYMPDELVPA